MKLIGASFPRTGTMSTWDALNGLGLPCYHMRLVAENETYANLWHDFFVKGKELNWAEVFGGFEATIDAPGAFVYESLLDAFPDAKVLLNLRDPKAWYKSFSTLTATIAQAAPLRQTNPRLNVYMTIAEKMFEKVFGGNLDESNCLRVFNEHNEQVQKNIPSDRLLVFRVEDGWKPLCNFLNKPIPDEDFPHLNQGGSTVREVMIREFQLA